jgi:hypothetical protein
VVVVVGVVAEGVGLGATTVKLTNGLVTPYRVAVISLFPAATPVTKPPEPAKDMIATLILELDHIALEVMSTTEPLELVPIATNCPVEPTTKLGGEVGSIIMEDNVGVGIDGRGGVYVGIEVGVFEQEAAIVAKTAISTIVKQYSINRIRFLFIVI